MNLRQSVLPNVTRSGWEISFRQVGDSIETLGISFSGKIVLLGKRGQFQLWHVKPGMVWSGLGRPWCRTASRLLLVKTDGDTAKIVKQCEPGAQWRTRRALFLAELASSSLA
jgi:hypothetical protein